MKILHVGYSDLVGGGNIAAYRIHRAMVDSGYHSKMLVAKKHSSDDSVMVPKLFQLDIVRRLIARIGSLLQPLYFGSNASKLGYDLIGCDIASFANRNKFDILNLHWTHNSFVSFRSIQSVRSPVVWTVHDMLTFTGGCNYSSGCRNFERGCGSCRVLGEKATPNDASRKILASKERLLSVKPEVIVAPSKWMQREVRASSLFRDKRVERIQYCLGADWFADQDRVKVRREFGIPDGSVVLLFASHTGANDPRKGFDLLDQALAIMASRWPEKKFVMLVVGGEKSDGITCGANGVTQINLGKLSAESGMSKAYAAADIFVAPSREDNLPLVVVESLSSGTPVVAFRLGGFPDLISEAAMGYLAKPFDVDELASGIYDTACSLSEDRRNQIRQIAKSRFSPAVIAENYHQLYLSLTGKKPTI